MSVPARLLPARPATAPSPARALSPAPRAAGLPRYLQRAALRIDAPDSPLEREADAVAALVPSALAPPEEQVATLPRPAAPAGSMAPAGSGAALDTDIRARLEPALGVDLGHVRVHADAEAHARAGALQAKAFTHGSDIWLGPGQSPRDLALMAHEAAHVVQQAGGVPMLQRRAADYQHPEDGALVRARLEGRIAAEVEDPPSNISPEEARRRMAGVDRGELAGKHAQVAPDARPDVDRAALARPVVEEAATATKEEADQPPEPVAEEEAKRREAERKEREEAALAPTTAATAAAETAFALAESIMEPLPEPAVVVPGPVEPVDAAGQPLPSDPVADEEVAALAGEAQSLREEGLAIRARAAEVRINAGLMQGNIALVCGGVAQARMSLAQAEDQLGYRREVAGQAGQALVVAKEKAATVAAGAPGFAAKAEEGSAESGPMTSEAGQMAAENAANTSDDPEAAEKAREQGGRIDEVRQGSATMDEAIRKTGEKAVSLSADAKRATAVNELTTARLTGVDQTLVQTGERLGQMREGTQAASDSVEMLAAEPDALIMQADELDRQGAGLVLASYELERRLHDVQAGYRAETRAVPAQELLPETEEALVQRQGEDGAAAEPAVDEGPIATDRYEMREQRDLVSELPTWLIGVEPETEAQRQERKARADKQRADEIAEIKAWGGAKLADRNAFEKMGMALWLSGGRLWRKIAGITVPDWRKAGKLLVGMLDPRSALAGVVSGLSMSLSGFMNLGQLSLQGFRDDWRGSLQNLLKSAADIATGITIVLGSITALAGLIAGIMTAITILSFGFAAPVTGPIIAFCTSVMVTVGGWTIVAGKIALILQALVLIKNLIDAACAESADQLQAQVDQIGADAGNMLNIGMQVAGAKIAQLGGRATQRQIIKAQGGVRAAAGLGAGARVMAGRGLRGVGRFARDLYRRGPREMLRKWRADRAARPPGPGLRERFKSWREKWREETKEIKGEKLYGKDFLLGSGIRSFGEAVDAAAITRLNVRIGALAAQGTPEALQAARQLAVERGRREASRLLRRLRAIDEGALPAPARGAPATLTQHGEFARGLQTAEEAYAAYSEALANAGGREVGIYQSMDTGEFAVRVGDFGSVRGPYDGEWLAVLHFHPNRGNVLTYRLPAPQDFNGAMWRFARTGKAVREMVEFDIPGVGRGRTEFGYEPGRKPLYVTIRQPDGRTATLRFADLNEYQAYWSSRATYLDPASPDYREFVRSLDDWLKDFRSEWSPPSSGQTMTGVGRPPGGGRPPVGPTLSGLRAEARLLPVGDVDAAAMGRWLNLVEDHPLVTRIREMRAMQLLGRQPTLDEVYALLDDFAQETGMTIQYVPDKAEVVRGSKIVSEEIKGVSLREVPAGASVEQKILVEEALRQDALAYFADLSHDIDSFLASRTQAVPPRDMPRLAALPEAVDIAWPWMGPDDTLEIIRPREFFHGGRILDYAFARRKPIIDAIQEIIDDPGRAYIWLAENVITPGSPF